ncbi:MAG: HDIG domain-containing protein, partial [Deltaproteobacteria bacterium]|nr:HDIG domain-containing protein [Deltaproteobacteria bacterium]
MNLSSYIFSFSDKLRDNLYRVCILFGTSIAITFVMTTLVSQLIEPPIWNIGQVAKRSVVSPTDYTIESADGAGMLLNYEVHRGETIVRAGDIISPEHYIKLNRLIQLQCAGASLSVAFGYVLLNIFILLSVYAFTIFAWPDFKPSSRDLFLIAGTLLGSCVMLQIFSILGRSLNLSFPDLSPTVLVLSAPLAAGGILLGVTLSAAAVFLFVISFALLTGVFLVESWELLLLIVLGNMVGVLSVSRCCKRSTFVDAGVKVAIANMAIVCIFLFVEPHFSFADNTTRILLAVLGGLCSGVFAAGLVPIAEYFGSYVTNIKLLELASIEHPLLRRLSVEAPGTWNHSMMLGQMGEVAAEAIGANPLLTRVGAYYHDIGKLKKPAYFGENQTFGENRHDKLTPSMSALIIRAHVKDGVELAIQHHLPKAVVELIMQHHGTGRIEFFYEKAINAASEEEIVDEAHYRYAGPKPQTKEAGILMLADAVEASCRSLSDHSHAKIQGLVQKRINRVFASGQLDESELTLKDLHAIARSLTLVLTGIYHRRVEYSEPADKRHKQSLTEVKRGLQSAEGKIDNSSVVNTSLGEHVKNGRRDTSAKNGS